MLTRKIIQGNHLVGLPRLLLSGTRNWILELMYRISVMKTLFFLTRYIKVFAKIRSDWFYLKGKKFFICIIISGKFLRISGQFLEKFKKSFNNLHKLELRVFFSDIMEFLKMSSISIRDSKQLTHPVYMEMTRRNRFVLDVEDEE